MISLAKLVAPDGKIATKCDDLDAVRPVRPALYKKHEQQKEKKNFHMRECNILYIRIIMLL